VQVLDSDLSQVDPSQLEFKGQLQQLFMTSEYATVCNADFANIKASFVVGKGIAPHHTWMWPEPRQQPVWVHDKEPWKADADETELRQFHVTETRMDWQWQLLADSDKFMVHALHADNWWPRVLKSLNAHFESMEWRSASDAKQLEKLARETKKPWIWCSVQRAEQEFVHDSMTIFLNTKTRLYSYMSVMRIQADEAPQITCSSETHPIFKTIEELGFLPDPDVYPGHVEEKESKRTTTSTSSLSSSTSVVRRRRPPVMSTHVTHTWRLMCIWLYNCTRIMYPDAPAVDVVATVLTGHASVVHELGQLFYKIEAPDEWDNRFGRLFGYRSKDLALQSFLHSHQPDQGTIYALLEDIIYDSRGYDAKTGTLQNTDALDDTLQVEGIDQFPRAALHDVITLLRMPVDDIKQRSEWWPRYRKLDQKSNDFLLEWFQAAPHSQKQRKRSETGEVKISSVVDRLLKKYGASGRHDVSFTRPPAFELRLVSEPIEPVTSWLQTLRGTNRRITTTATGHVDVDQAILAKIQADVQRGPKSSRAAMLARALTEPNNVIIKHKPGKASHAKRDPNKACVQRVQWKRSASTRDVVVQLSRETTPRVLDVLQRVVLLLNRLAFPIS